MIAALRHRPGELIQDRYEVESVLGSGAFGTVYKCCDRELNVIVAVKELHVLDDPATGGGEREAALAQFRSEATHLSHLRHPHIVSGHYQPHSGTWLICPVDGYAFRGAPACPEHGAMPLVLRQRHYLVMEYLDGGDLNEIATMQGGILPIGAALRYVRQIAEALQLIHARGWVHRDIKPENIRLRQEGDEAVLLDFGIATETGVAGEFGTRRMRHTTGGGTFGYAPESSHERRHPDARSDIHALGMTLYRLVSGRDPQEPVDLAALRAGRPRQFNPDISPALETLILEAIDPNPERRHQNATEFLRDIMRTLERPSGNGIGNGNGMSNGISNVVPTPAPVDSATPRFIAPLPFSSGEAAGDLQTLVRLLEAYPGEGKQHLVEGDLATWFDMNGYPGLAHRAREVVEQYGERTDQALEAIVQATGLVGPPTLQVNPVVLDFGRLRLGQRKSIMLDLVNQGRGHLFGVLRSTLPGIDVEPSFDGNHATVQITARSRELHPGRHQGDVIIDSSAGELQLPFAIEVMPSNSLSTATTVVFWAMIGMLCGQMLRSLPLIHQENPPGWDWLTPNSPIQEPLTTSLLFGFVIVGMFLLLTVGEATRRKSCLVLLSGGCSSLGVGLLGTLLGTQILIRGDIALHPYMQDLVHHWAAGGWMFLGGVLGAAYGTLRRVRDIFSPLVLHIVYGWLISMVIMYGILLAAMTLVPKYG